MGFGPPPNEGGWWRTALDNWAAMHAMYAAAQPLQETPTGESVSAVAATLAAIEDPGPKYIILATDGEPDTCDQPNPRHGQRSRRPYPCGTVAPDPK